MKKETREAGFALKLMIIVVGVCIIFIVMAGLAGRLGAGKGLLTPNMLMNYDASSAIETKTNPLLDFGPDNGFGGSIEGTRSVPNTDGQGVSAYKGQISLSAGNTYTLQPHEEYLVLRNNSAAPLNITGWALTNSKGSRPIQNSNNTYFYPTPDTAIIGQGTEFLDPSGKFNLGPIVLAPGDTAYIMTGGPFTQFPFSISTSFRENVCLGYLENYPFSPQINLACPSLSGDQLLKTTTDECYDYVTSLSRCANPEKNDKKVYDKQPSHCKAYLATRIGYPQCVTQNSRLSDFSMKQWRVFLGQKKEMWAASRETITLYDAKGHVVTQMSY